MLGFPQKDLSCCFQREFLQWCMNAHAIVFDAASVETLRYLQGFEASPLENAMAKG